MRFLFIAMMFLTLIDAKTLEPTHVYTGSGAVTDLMYQNGLLYSATAEGAVDIFNIKEQKLVQTITVPTIKDFTGEEVNAKVYSVDIAEGKIMIVSQGKMGYRRIHIFVDNALTEVISTAKSFTIAKAKFVDANTILISLLSNELILYDIKNDKNLYREQIGGSKFSNFALNEDKSQVVFSCESGVLSVVDVKSGKVLNELQGQNVDNVYKVDFRSGKVSAAGQDRRGALYDAKSGKGSYIEGEFLIYGTALSPSTKKVAFAMDEKNNISIYNTSSKSKIALLKGQKSTLNVIIFKDENILFSASDDNIIMVWDLKK